MFCRLIHVLTIVDATLVCATFDGTDTTVTRWEEVSTASGAKLSGIGNILERGKMNLPARLRSVSGVYSSKSKYGEAISQKKSAIPSLRRCLNINIRDIGNTLNPIKAKERLPKSSAVIDRILSQARRDCSPE